MEKYIKLEDIKEIMKLYSNSHFAEFTQEISPAYTIADLKKILTK